MNPKCPRPLPDQTLLDWWVGESSPADRSQAERHLLGCTSCTSRAEVVQVLSEGVRGLARSGRLTTVVTQGLIDRLREEGRTIREYRVSAGGSVQCTVAPDDEVLIARLGLSGASASRVDLLVRIGDDPAIRIPDIPYAKGAGEVVMAFPVDVLQAAPVHVERLRLVAVESRGERLLGEYTFNHTPWPGSPDIPPSA